MQRSALRGLERLCRSSLRRGTQLAGRAASSSTSSTGSPPIGASVKMAGVYDARNTGREVICDGKFLRMVGAAGRELGWAGPWALFGDRHPLHLVPEVPGAPRGAGAQLAACLRRPPAAVDITYTRRDGAPEQHWCPPAACLRRPPAAQVDITYKRRDGAPEQHWWSCERSTTDRSHGIDGAPPQLATDRPEPWSLGAAGRQSAPVCRTRRAPPLICPAPPAAVAVFAVIKRQGHEPRLLIVKQFRPAVGKVTVELCAGGWRAAGGLVCGLVCGLACWLGSTAAARPWAVLLAELLALAESGAASWQCACAP
jgi:hypothetical protein